MSIPPSDAAVDPDRFRAAFRRLAGGVVVVTCWHEGRPWGLTVSSCSAVTATPPRVLVSLQRNTCSYAAILDQGGFGLCLLHSEQKEVAEHAARTGAPKFLDDFCEPRRPDEAPVIRGSAAHLDCLLHRNFELGDHALLIGDIREAALPEDPQGPLVYFDRAYHRVGEPI